VCSSNSTFILPFSSDGTTSSGVPSLCAPSGNDQWFTWTATKEGLLFNSLSPGNPGIVIYSSCGDANTGNFIDCASVGDPNKVLLGWNIGDELLIKIFDFSGQNSDVAFCLSAFTPPPNNFCSGAIPITPSSTNVVCNTSFFNLPFSTDGTTDSGVPSVCSSSGNDQWFTWTATEMGLFFSSGFPGRPGIAIYANCADAVAGNEIACSNINLINQRLSGWNIGDELLIQIYDLSGQNSDVAFCLKTIIPPPNDFCNGAIPITPTPDGTACSTSFMLPFQTDFTTRSGTGSCNIYSNSFDQWFTWTATTRGLIFDSQLPGLPGISIYSSCSNAEIGNFIECVTPGFTRIMLGGWEIGDELLIQIFDNAQSPTNVTFCLETLNIVMPPPNDDCSGAIPIEPAPTETGCSPSAAFPLPFLLDGTTDSGVPSTCSSSGNDQWFTWTATEAGLVFSSRYPGNPGISIFANCTDAAQGNEIACAEPNPSGLYEKLRGWNIGDELLIQIYDYSGQSSNVVFCLETFIPPPNDFCNGAIPIIPSASGTGCNGGASFILPFSTDETSDSGVPHICANSGNDQWFTWTATTNGLPYSIIVMTQKQEMRLFAHL